MYMYGCTIKTDAHRLGQIQLHATRIVTDLNFQFLLNYFVWAGKLLHNEGKVNNLSLIFKILNEETFLYLR